MRLLVRKGKDGKKVDDRHSDSVACSYRADSVTILQYERSNGIISGPQARKNAKNVD